MATGPRRISLPFEAAKTTITDPGDRPNHTRGGSVDVTLVDAERNELDMPSNRRDVESYTDLQAGYA